MRPAHADAGGHVRVVQLAEDHRLLLQDVVVVIVVVIIVVLVLVVVVADADGHLEDEMREQHDGGNEAKGAVQSRVTVRAGLRGRH